MLPEETSADIVSRMYETTLSGVGADNLARMIGERFRAPMVGVRVRIGSWHLTRSFFGYREEAQRRYESTYEAADPFRSAIDARPSLSSVRFESISENDRWTATSYYKEMLAPSDVEHVLATSFVSGSLEIRIAVGRTKQDGRFDRGADPVIEMFGRHLQRAAGLRAMLLRRRNCASPSVEDVVRSLPLTARQVEIACALISGRHPVAVAADLGMAYETMRTHLRQLFRKTGTGNRAELIAFLYARIATQANFIDHDSSSLTQPGDGHHDLSQ